MLGSAVPQATAHFKSKNNHKGRWQENSLYHQSILHIEVPKTTKLHLKISLLSSHLSLIWHQEMEQSNKITKIQKQTLETKFTHWISILSSIPSKFPTFPATATDLAVQKRLSTFTVEPNRPHQYHQISVWKIKLPPNSSQTTCNSPPLPNPTPLKKKKCFPNLKPQNPPEIKR